MTEKKKHINIFEKMGKNPEQDWLLIIILFVILVITILIILGLHFLNTKAFIKTGLTGQDSNSITSVKTKEEELRDIINMYLKKKSVHEGLLGRSKFEVEKAPATTTASTTIGVATSSQRVASSTQKSQKVATSTGN